MSRTSPSWSTPRHRYIRFPAIRTTISSRCHRALGRGRPCRSLRAISGPNGGEAPRPNPRTVLSIALEEGGSRGAGLYSENSAVDVDFRTCDVGRFIGSQEQNGVRHLVNLSWPAHRHYAHAFGSHGGVGSATRCCALAA